MDDDKGRLTMELFSTEVNGKDWHIACLQKLDTTSWDCQWTANDHANKDSNYFQHAKMDLIITNNNRTYLVLCSSLWNYLTKSPKRHYSLRRN